MDQRTTITLPGGVRRITDPAAYVAALEAREKIIQKKANRVHGNPGVGGIFKVDKVSAVYQKPRQTLPAVKPPIGAYPWRAEPPAT